MVPRQDDLAAVLPHQREHADGAQILADDRLIEGIRTGQITGDVPASPLVRMLVQWRQVVAGA